MTAALEHYRLIAEQLDSLEIGLCLFGEDDCALLWNRMFLRLFPEHDGHVHVGESYADNLRRFYATRLEADELPQIDRYIAEGVARHRAQSLPFVFEHRARWLRVASTPVPGIGRVRIWTPVASPAGLAGLRPAVPTVEGALENLADGVMVADRDGRIGAVNEAFVRQYGLSGRDQAVGRRFEDILEAAWRRAGADTVGGADWRPALTEHRRFAGAPFEVPLPGDRWLRVVEQHAAEGSVISTHVDISAMKRLQIELSRAREAAEAATIAKSQFLAVMSHELRTPMTGVMGMIDLLELTPLDGEQRRSLETMRSSARTLLSLLNDILDYSKIEAGQLSLEDTAFDVTAIVEEVVQLFTPAASERGNSLRLDTGAGTPVPVRGDPLRLKQVLLNLVGNAVKFTEDGIIDVTLEVAAASAGTLALRVTVSDTGIGMSDEQLGQLFRPFAQADLATTRRYGGSGLGLVICKRIIEAMGGDIGVDSVLREGSRFWFTLRVPAAEIAAAAPAEHAAQSAGRPLRLLLAEDNDVSRGLIVAMLTRYGHVVEAVGNGRLAVALLQADRGFDAVLMDIQMPEMDGLEATARIRQMPGPAARLPIIALTANATPEHRELYARSGFDASLTKPIVWSALLETLEALAGRMAPREVAEAMPAAAAVLDRPALDAVVEAVGEDAFLRLLDHLEAEIQAKVREIRQAVTAGDLQAVRELGHGLKGMTANFGLSLLMGIGEELNRGRYNLDIAAQLASSLEEAVPVTLAALAAWRTEQSTAETVG